MENKGQLHQNGLRELNTPFGKLYITEWEVRRNNLYPESEPDGRITIYDSRKGWLDYYSEDYFYDPYDKETEARNEKDFAKQEYENFCEMLEKGGEKNTCEDFMDWLGINFCYVGTDKEKAAYELSDGHPEELLPDELETNEYVNHVGDHYIVRNEY